MLFFASTKKRYDGKIANYIALLIQSKFNQFEFYRLLPFLYEEIDFFFFTNETYFSIHIYRYVYTNCLFDRSLHGSREENLISRISGSSSLWRVAHGQQRVEILRVKPEISQGTKSRRLMALQTARRGSRIQRRLAVWSPATLNRKGGGATLARIAFRDKRTTIISENNSVFSPSIIYIVAGQKRTNHCNVTFRSNNWKLGYP